MVIGFMAICWMGRMGSVYGDSSNSPEFVVPVMEKVNIMDEDELRHILLTSGIVSICMCDIQFIFVKRHFPTFVTTTMEEEYRRYYRMGPNDLHWLQQPMVCIVPFHYQPIMKYWKSYGDM